MELSKGKPVTTSVPSISIRFHANAEQLEELYASDDEHLSSSETTGSAGATTSTAGSSEPESSPLKYLPRLVKRSTSIDITPTTTIDASPPSDPWRFFSDIKGKITKSVEEKITEIKSRNQEDGSPRKSVKDSKDNSSVSDSEELSESSISKTCGIVSTTEGAEMSSDDDTPSLEKDRKVEYRKSGGETSGLRQRFRMLKPNSTAKEGTIGRSALKNIYNISSEIEQALPEENEVESAVDALEDSNLQNHDQIDENILELLQEEFDNIMIDKDRVINIKETPGSELKQQSHWPLDKPQTVYAPVGFVDLREPPASIKRSTFMPLSVIAIFVLSYFLIHKYSSYLAGVILGIAATYIYFYVKSVLETPSRPAISIMKTKEILEVPAVKEFQPLAKYEGWVNEFPEVYNPHTYHISQTQSVFLRLEGNLLRISHTKSKVPKRALWNEPKIKPVFTNKRIYNLLGAKVTLLPEGLAKKRHWSKKYPICVTLNKDQMNFEVASILPGTQSFHNLKIETEDEKEKEITPKPTKAKRFTFGKKKKFQALRFSKLTEENEDYEMDSENSRASTPSPDDPNAHEHIVEEALNENLEKDEDDDGIKEHDFDTLPDDWGTFTPDDSPTETKLYIFGRTDREKEDWFRRLTTATHKGANIPMNEALDTDKSISDTLLDMAITEMDYMRYMLIFNKLKRIKVDSSEPPEENLCDLQWLNAFVGRILFDCLRDDNFTLRVKEKIQRKLSSIKLPYFIEELLVTELNLGQTPPLIHKASKPLIDDRGLWVDLDVTYEGLVALKLQTKLNLMKLKQPHASENNKNMERLAMFNSDVEDSAESTSDEDACHIIPTNPSQATLDSSGNPVSGLGGTSNTSKKFIKMVDKIAESKFFQAATENRYIKKAMEGVSNTDLRLKVEIKSLVGTLVLNIPPPPSDRVWIGFRPTPHLALFAQPIVGERNITYLRITSWIEKKLLQEFQKLLVIPNMEDFIVPVMSPELPH